MFCHYILLHLSCSQSTTGMQQHMPKEIGSPGCYSLAHGDTNRTKPPVQSSLVMGTVLMLPPRKKLSLLQAT